MKLKPRASWSAATCRRLFRLADLSARPRRVQRRDDYSGTGFQPVWWWRRTRKQSPTGKVVPPDKLEACPTAEAGNSKTGSERQIVDGDKSPAQSGDKSSHSKAAFSFIELILMICILVLLTIMLIPSLGKAREKSRLIDCMGNLQQVGLAFRLWAGDSMSSMPMRETIARGGTLEVSTDVWRTFLVMSNELGLPGILLCPSDSRPSAPSWATLANTNISYFIGLDADESMPQLLLSGDHHLSNGRSTTNKVLSLQTNDTVRWSGTIHQGSGNIALADGSVHQVSSATLPKILDAARQENWRVSSNATLRLAMP